MIYAIADLHGYPHGRFLDLLEKAGFCDEDFLFVIGDVVDRNGDGGIETLQWLMLQPNAELILGNHEAMLLACSFVFEEISEESIEKLKADKIGVLSDYISNGGGVTLKRMRQLPRQEQADILRYLREAPVYELVSAGENDYLLVHAGLENFRPDKKLSEYSPGDLIWSSPKMGERFYPDLKVIFGHRPTFTYGEGYRGTTVRTDTWIAIDAGAGYGERPVLLRLDDLREFRLKEL